MDAKAQPFEQTARVVNISRSGALIDGMLRMLKPGETIHVQLDNEQAEFRVVWAGKAGTELEGQLGIEGLPAQPSIWNLNLAQCTNIVAST